jgi:hypothetical protein
MDKWGFPILPQTNFLYKNKAATLRECAIASKDPPLTLTSQDPILVREGNGFKLEWNRSRTRGAKANSNWKRPSKPVVVDIEGSVKPPPRKPVIPGHGPGMIAGLTQQEYHRRYRFAQRVKEDQKARRPQLRRYAKWLATIELANEFNERFQQGEWKELVDETMPAAMTVQRVNLENISDSPGSKRKRKSELMSSPSMVTRKRAKVSDEPATVQSSSPVAALEASSSTQIEIYEQPNMGPSELLESPSCIAPVARPRPTIGLKRPIIPTEDDISTLVEGLESCSTQGVHVNPPGSAYYLPNLAPPKGRKVLVVKFKFHWLKKFDWFVEEPSNTPPADISGVNEVEKEAGLSQQANDILNAQRASIDLVALDATLRSSGAGSSGKDKDTPHLYSPHPGRHAKRKLKVGVYRVKKLGRPPKDIPQNDSLILKFVLPQSSEQIDEDVEMADVIDELQPTSIPIDLDEIDRPPVDTSESINIGDDRPSGMTKSSHRIPLPRRSSDVVHTPQIKSSTIGEEAHKSADHRIPDATISIEPNGNTLLNRSNNQVNGNEDDLRSGLSANTGHETAVDENQEPNVTISDLTDTPTRGNIIISAETPKSHGTGRKPITGTRQGAVIGTGSSRFKRGVMILDIVNKCGGAFPGDGEIILPFNSLEKKTGTTIADRQTIMKAIKNLVDQGKLKKVAYFFTASTGRPLTRHVFLLPELSFDNPKVQDLVERCKECYPRRYLPPEVEDRPPPDSKKSTPGTSRYFRPDESIVLVPDVYRNAASDPNVQPWALDFFERQNRLAEARQRLFEKTRHGGEAPGSLVEPKAAQVVLTKTFDQRKDVTNPLQLNIGPSVFDDTYQERNPKRLKISSSNYVWNGVAYTRVETPQSIGNVAAGPPKWPTWGMRVFMKQQARHQRRILAPKQTFHPLTGTFSTEFKIRTGRIAKYTVESPEAAEEEVADAEVIESESEVDMDGLNREVQQWMKSGHKIQIIGDGPDSGFVVYSPSHPHVTAPIVPIVPKLRKPSQTVAIPRPPIKRLLEPPIRTEISRLPDRMPLGPPGRPILSSLARPSHPAPILTPSYDAMTTDRHQRTKDQWIKLNPVCIVTPRASKKLLYTVIILRTLAGGVSQNVPWVLVDSVFLKEDYPNYSQQNFRRRWEWMTKYHKDVIERLQFAFEEAFLEAYENDHLPHFDTSDIHGYDWPWIIEWAQKNIDVIGDQTALPQTKAALDNLFELSLLPTRNDRTFESAYRHNYTTYKRSVVANTTEMSVPLRGKLASSAESVDLQLARSWARASLVNAETVNGDPVANSKLRNLGDSLLRKAIDGLLEDKVILQASRNSKSSSKSARFQLQDKVSMLLRTRPLKSQTFADGVAFKKQLDLVFEKQKASYVLPQDASDGHIMALNELVAAGRVKLIPQLPAVNSTIGAPIPRLSAWGMNEGSYEAKKIDRKVYMWGLHVEPTENYLFGLPLQNAIEHMPIPQHHPDDVPGREKIPFWVDIHGNFMPNRWQICLMAVVGLCSLEAAITVNVLKDILKNFLATWELELIIQWLKDIDVLHVDHEEGLNGPLVAKEWWWTVIPPE